LPPAIVVVLTRNLSGSEIFGAKAQTVAGNPGRITIRNFIAQNAATMNAGARSTIFGPTRIIIVTPRLGKSSADGIKSINRG